MLLNSSSQVVSVCQGGSLIVWMIDSGQKVKTFNNVHGNAEVTSLAQDPSETRIFTGGSDGTIKVCARWLGTIDGPMTGDHRPLLNYLHSGIIY